MAAGAFDDRFLLTAPGGAGSSGPTPYRYDSFGNVPFRNAEGDAIGFEGAKPIYTCLNAAHSIALDLDMGNTGHGLTAAQAQHIVDYANFILYGKALAPDVKTQLTTDPYIAAGTYSTYYGGLDTMMPWASKIAHCGF